ncbi:host attachment protein [Mesorhizobium sp. M00.F.Ca.ET.216.01.1.1]|uniref:host attachment protein n=1 Tax=Mesorhizobium sp. M00.F.Ca.ET.216.01.1.1 TaxID=2500528 RepID=UPI000FDC7C5F|nr:host attachment protein [Mesorhizobium sp. M00.F.Ca.ET.216.01.1.1]TGQ35597.1 hypothetical protein EN859_023025 [Mesorhizobium sp. M00.F.Ca.ET.216.01.1.1]
MHEIVASRSGWRRLSVGNQFACKAGLIDAHEVTMKPRSTWGLVADEARARILRDVLSAGDEREDLVFHSERRQFREIMADKPGRSFASTGARRSAMEYLLIRCARRTEPLLQHWPKRCTVIISPAILTNWSSLHRPRCWAIFARPFRKTVRSQPKSRAYLWMNEQLVAVLPSLAELIAVFQQSQVPRSPS